MEYPFSFWVYYLYETKEKELCVMGRTKTYETKDILKLELAEQLGYAEKVRQYGWGELTSVESGKLGGCMRSYIKKHHWG